MRTVFSGTLEECIKYIKEEESKFGEDEIPNLDIVENETSDEFYYVKELDGWDLYPGTF